MVAGARIELAYIFRILGYEPSELPVLYPAIYLYRCFSTMEPRQNPLLNQLPWVVIYWCFAIDLNNPYSLLETKHIKCEGVENKFLRNTLSKNYLNISLCEFSCFPHKLPFGYIYVSVITAFCFYRLYISLCHVITLLFVFFGVYFNPLMTAKSTNATLNKIVFALGANNDC